jgi:maltose alpha-D-glucosyltransferase/alpha-amylase
MLRSLDYAAHAVAFGRPEAERAAALAALTAWEAQAREAFLGGYLHSVAESPVPLAPATAEALRSACGPFELQKAAYELRYELDNRPDWVAIPLAGISRILGRSVASD